MTLIVTLPFCAPPPTARAAAGESAADAAATGDPFATALAAALTAGLLTQPAVPVQLGEPAGTHAASADAETAATPDTMSALPPAPAGPGASRGVGRSWTAPAPSALDAAAAPAPAERPVITVPSPTAPALTSANAPPSPAGAVAGTIERLQSNAETTLDGVAAAWPTGGAVTIERVLRLAATSPADPGPLAAAMDAGLNSAAAPDGAEPPSVAAQADGLAPCDAFSSLIDRVVQRMRATRAQDDQRGPLPEAGASAPSAAAASVPAGDVDAASAARTRRAAAQEAQTAASAGEPTRRSPIAEPNVDDSASTTADPDTQGGNADAWPPLHLVKFAPTNRGLKRTAWTESPSARGADARRVAPAAGNTATTAANDARPGRAARPADNTPGPLLSMLMPSPHHGARSTVEPIAELAAAPAASEAAPLPTPNTVTLRVGEGDGATTRVRVTVRGDSVQTRIVAPDAPAATQLAAAAADLRSGLEQHGLSDAGASILAAPPSHAADRGTSSAAAPPATDAVAGTPSSRGTDAPSDRHSSDSRQRGEDTATDRPGQHGSRSQQRSKRERER